MFVDDNVQFTSANSTYKGKYTAVQHYLGTFDYAKSEVSKNVIDKNVRKDLYYGKIKCTPFYE